MKNIVIAQKKTISDHGIETLKIEDEFPDNDEVELEIEGDEYLNAEEISDNDEDDELEEYKLLVRGREKDKEKEREREQDRMNINFERQKRDDRRDERKEKSSNKMYFEKKSLD